MRTITISEVKNMNCNTIPVKDNSVRGIATTQIADVKVGDKVVIENYFTLVVEG